VRLLDSLTRHKPRLRRPRSRTAPGDTAAGRAAGAGASEEESSSSAEESGDDGSAAGDCAWTARRSKSWDGRLQETDTLMGDSLPLVGHGSTALQIDCLAD
jgi:hypothetical protein